jgi:hypothetical protein
MRAGVLMVLIAQMVMPGVVEEMALAQQPSEVCVSSIPANIQAGVLAQDITGLLQASPTFRMQCERIAEARSLRVHLELVQSLGGPRGETTITRYQSGALHASVRISFGQDYRELIAHEFEHVIEQLEGVDLQAEADRGRAWLVDARVFETRRAWDTGQRVRRECDRSTAHVVAAAHALR